jgi:hypothetical protein
MKILRLWISFIARLEDRLDVAGSVIPVQGIGQGLRVARPQNVLLPVRGRSWFDNSNRLGSDFLPRMTTPNGKAWPH